VVNAVFKPRRLVWAGAFVVVVIACLYSYTFLTRPASVQLADIETDKVELLRSTTTISTTLREGLNAFERGNYNQAIKKLNEYVQSNPQYYRANYYLGLSYLMKSKRSLPGLQYGFDEKETESGIRYLKKALQFAEENQFYQEDCYWYLGQAYVMLGELDVAKGLFHNILLLDQQNLTRKDAAREMVSLIDEELGR
jgi:tetratricopeptide (TPR) repeat protein